MINYSFKTELTKERTIYTDAVFTSGDVKGYRFSFNFFENGKPVNIKNHVLTVKAKRADGIVVTDAGIIQDEYTAYYDVKNSMLAICGEVSFEIALSDDTGMYVTTKELIANVRKGYGENDISVYDTAPVISSLLSAASTLAVSADTANEAANNADLAANSANQSADRANLAVDSANQALALANQATDSALEATEIANQATDRALVATETANQAAENTNAAIEDANNAIANMNQVAENYEPFIVNVILNDDMTDVISAPEDFFELNYLITVAHRPVLCIVRTESSTTEALPLFAGYMERIDDYVGCVRMLSYTHTEAHMITLLCRHSMLEGTSWIIYIDELATTQLVEEAMESVITKYGLGGDNQ